MGMPIQNEGKIISFGQGNLLLTFTILSFVTWRLFPYNVYDYIEKSLFYVVKNKETKESQFSPQKHLLRMSSGAEIPLQLPFFSHCDWGSVYHYFNYSSYILTSLISKDTSILMKKYFI